MKIKMYTKDDCGWCEKAKVLIGTLQTVTEVDFEELKIGRDITREDFKLKYPEFKTVPQIFIDQKFIGGYTDFEMWWIASEFKKEFDKVKVSAWTL